MVNIQFGKVFYEGNRDDLKKAIKDHQLLFNEYTRDEKIYTPVADCFFTDEKNGFYRYRWTDSNGREVASRPIRGNATRTVQEALADATKVVNQQLAYYREVLLGIRAKTDDVE